ncbi:MAG TPA: NADH-quinone oxidoreductase subunit N [Actinomycetota bacterium]|nr:NADH-quinone oxidoreductase subunit N [Actinomycetota bacterium]
MELAQAVVQADIDLHALAPELVLTATACLVLVVDLFMPREAKWVAMPLSAAGLLGTLAAVMSLVGEHRTTLAESFEVDAFSLLFKGLFCLMGLLILGMSLHHFRESTYHEGEYYFLLLCGLLGGVVMASARDLISIFIALELISIPGIVMTALRKRNAKSNESALKFFLFSVLSSAVMLLGMSLIYGVTGTTQLDGIREAFASALGGPAVSPGISLPADHPFVVMSVFFIVIGFAFKISAVPFHFWAPDTYEGAPSPVAAFLSTASKIGGFVGLLVLMFVAFPQVADGWRPVFAVLAALTMTVGNLIALRQQHIIRLLAYSGIAQSGYVLVAFALIDPGAAETNRQAFESALIYLAIYGIMDLGAFAAAVAFARRGGTYFIEDYRGLWNRSPVLATLLAAFLVSLAGAPPMAGAWAKLFVFLATIDAQVYWLAVVMGLNATIAAWYYLAVVKRMFFDTTEVSTEPIEVPAVLRVVMAGAAALLFAGFVYPPLITELAERSFL